MRALVVFIVIGCGHGKSAPESPPATTMLDCAKVADHVGAIVVADKPRPGATPAAVKDLVATRCQADKWSDDTKQCLHAIATIKEGRACATKMTDEQREAIKTQAKALRKDTSEPVEPDEHGSDWIRHVVEEPGTPTR